MEQIASLAPERVRESDAFLDIRLDDELIERAGAELCGQLRLTLHAMLDEHVDVVFATRDRHADIGNKRAPVAPERPIRPENDAEVRKFLFRKGRIRPIDLVDHLCLLKSKNRPDLSRLRQLFQATHQCHSKLGLESTRTHVDPESSSG